MSPLLVLKARAEARALLFEAADYVDLGQAITPVLVYAHESGLEDQIGYAGVLDVVRAAFKKHGIEIGGEPA